MHKTIKFVAAFEAFKGVLALVAASGVLLLVHKDLHALAIRLVEHAHLNPAAHYPSIFIVAVKHIQEMRLTMIALGALAYSTLRFIEAYGLYHEASWAEVLAAVSGVIYVPFEVNEYIHNENWLSIGALLVNFAVVAIMVAALILKRRNSVKQVI